MAKFEVGVVIIALFAIAYAGRQEDDSQEAHYDSQDYEGRVPQIKITDVPRIFDHTTPCPAKVFFLDCNLCSCTKPGSRIGYCTLMGCPPIPQIMNWGEEGVVCPAGRRFYAKSNKCRCNSDGKSAVCTLKNFPSPNDLSE